MAARRILQLTTTKKLIISKGDGGLMMMRGQIQIRGELCTAPPWNARMTDYKRMEKQASKAST